MSEPSPYAGRPIALATRHGKQRALARPFATGLGAELVLADVDTDAFGRFDGLRPRPDPPRLTCRRKAEAGLAATGLRCALASEGSFGPHPQVPLLAVGQEWLVFIDRERELVVEEQLLVARTNLSQLRLGPDDDPGPWLARIGHPSHGVLVRPSQPPLATPLWRDCDGPAALARAIRRAAALSPDGLALLETDMRAHRNPTRMASLRRLGFRLVRRLATPCPVCRSPGFGVRESIAGLPCAWCRTPTALALHELIRCGVCSHQEERPRRDGLLSADPGACPLCNP